MQDHETLNEQPGSDLDIEPVKDAPDTTQDVTADEPEGSAERVDAQGTMRWSEFNRRAQELERERAALEQRAESVKSYEEFARALDADEELREQVTNAFSRSRERGTARPTAQPTEDMRAIKNELMETRVELAAQRIQTELDLLQREHKLSKEEAQAVMGTALKEGLVDHRTPREAIAKRLKMVYRDLHFDKAKGAGERDLVEKLREGQRAASPGGRPKGADTDTEPNYDPKMSFEQIAFAEMKRLGVKR